MWYCHVPFQKELLMWQCNVCPIAYWGAELFQIHSAAIDGFGVVAVNLNVPFGGHDQVTRI